VGAGVRYRPTVQVGAEVRYRPTVHVGAEVRTRFIVFTYMSFIFPDINVEGGHDGYSKL
jgi:hypothetical protein